MTLSQPEREVDDGGEEEAEAGGREREGDQAEEEEDVARQVIDAAAGRDGRTALRAL